ncbi:hypothetical protein FB451DRAFT_1189501 [Mycena latifolia]|nr:hypothetical protein FB451DRAFT_1189501 [Mycena latifolia]
MSKSKILEYARTSLLGAKAPSGVLMHHASVSGLAKMARSLPLDVEDRTAAHPASHVLSRLLWSADDAQKGAICPKSTVPPAVLVLNAPVDRLADPLSHQVTEGPNPHPVSGEKYCSGVPPVRLGAWPLNGVEEFFWTAIRTNDESFRPKQTTPASREAHG